MHTIKITPTYYLNISVQAANLSDCRIESNRKKIDSVARIESNRNFFARIGMLYSILTLCGQLILRKIQCFFVTVRAGMAYRKI